MMSSIPLILVVGGDALALRVCEELCATQGHRVALLWVHDHELAAKLDRLGCEYFPHAPNNYDALRVAGVMEATSIMSLSDDDRLNLQVALKARDLNPAIRLVLRQFNRTLGRSSSKTSRTAPSSRWHRTPPPPSSVPRSIRPVFTRCSFPIATASRPGSRSARRPSSGSPA